MKRIGLAVLFLSLCAPFILATTKSDVVGTWNCETKTEEVLEFKLILFEKNGHLFGRYTTEHQELALRYIRILNDELRFVTETRGMKIDYRCTVEGDAIKGTISSGELSVDFTGTRDNPEQEK